MKLPGEQRVALVGMGGLGCPALGALLAQGVRRVTLHDGDRVELGNLHRQPWYRDEDVGELKAQVAARRAEEQFPGARLTPVPSRVTAATVDALFATHDWVLDGTDDVATKFLLSDAAVRARKVLVYGGVVGLSGQVLAVVPGGPCLRCLYESIPGADELPTCASAGVMGSLAGTVGALQVVQGLRAHLRGAAGERGTLFRVNGRTLEARKVSVFKNPDCIVCAPEASKARTMHEVGGHA